MHCESKDKLSQRPVSLSIAVGCFAEPKRRWTLSIYKDSHLPFRTLESRDILQAEREDQLQEAPSAVGQIMIDSSTEPSGLEKICLETVKAPDLKVLSRRPVEAPLGRHNKPGYAELRRSGWSSAECHPEHRAYNGPSDEGIWGKSLKRALFACWELSSIAESTELAEFSALLSCDSVRMVSKGLAKLISHSCMQLYFSNWLLVLRKCQR